jgi:hypothetical protein
MTFTGLQSYHMLTSKISASRMHLSVPYGSHSKQPPFSETVELLVFEMETWCFL